MRFRPLRILGIPILMALARALPGGAQEALPDRFAFADTTLLRDTLGLHFDRLFQLAESLRITPDTLRAISIRYRFPPLRMVDLADSLHVPVDSVGPFLEREQFNPLARRDARSARFSYTSGYTVQQTRSSWSNSADYNLAWSQIFLRNLTTIQFDRYQSGSQTTTRQSRSANTETGWKINPDYSVGGRAVLSRFDSDDPSSISRVGESRNDFQFSFRSRQQPSPGISSEFNVFSGVLGLENSRQDKRGLNNDVNGRIRVSSGEWFLHELSGHMSGNLARTRVVRTGVTENTRDVIGDLTGTLALFENSRYGLSGNYGYQKSRVRQPDDTGKIQDVVSNGANADATLRAQFAPEGTLNLSGQFTLSDQVTALSGPSSRRTQGLSLDGRHTLRGWGLEGRFRTDLSSGEVPRASLTGGYGEDITTRALEGTLTRRLFSRLSTRLNANIGLTRYRYFVIGNYGTPPVSRDQVQQAYRIDGSYTFSPDFNTGVALDVSRIQLVNLPSASTAANNTQRSYRAEWRWTYRLLRGLTATQRNTLGANYTAYQFVGQSDRLVLDYGTSTTLNAVLTPRLTVDLTHLSQATPSGNYNLSGDGRYYFRRADETKSYSLSSRVSYTPTPGLSLTIEPFFRQSQRGATQSGVATLQRTDRNLNFMGNANLNLPVGRRGQLSGSIGRTYFAARGIGYVATQPVPSPRTESDYWAGTLNLSWRL